MTECDHVLGLLCVAFGEHELLLASQREREAASVYAANQRWLAQGQGLRRAVERIKALDTPEKALAAVTDFFAYCPRCGERLGAAGDG